MKQDSFSGRYAIKLSSSIVIAVINGVIQMLLPRTFSVEAYGMYSYNLNVFTSVVVLSNLSTSNAMVSKLSRRNEERDIIRFYLLFFLFISILLNIVTFGLYMAEWINEFFCGQTIFLVLLGLNAAIFNKLLTDTISMYDAMAISRFPAMIQTMLKIFMCICVCIGYFLGVLNLYVFYILQSSITLMSFILLLIALLKEHKRKYVTSIGLSIREYCQEFYQFCKPLVLVSCWSQLMIIVMNWALMNYAGGTEQAMYGVALQLNILISYIFSPYAELLKREFAVIADNQEYIQHKLLQSMQHMYWIVAYFTIFISVCADWIVLFLFGENYIGAILATRLIMFYTLYQAWGQVGGSFLLATEQTKKQAIFSGISQLFVLVCTFIFQVPNIFFPEGLGVNGIALNYMISNLISTLMLISYCVYYTKIQYIKMFEIQLKTLICCICAALFGRIIAIMFTVTSQKESTLITKIFISGIIYTVIIVVSLWVHPQMIGFKREQIVQRLRRNKT